MNCYCTHTEEHVRHLRQRRKRSTRTLAEMVFRRGRCVCGSRSTSSPHSRPALRRAAPRKSAPIARRHRRRERDTCLTWDGATEIETEYILQRRNLHICDYIFATRDVLNSVVISFRFIWFSLDFFSLSSLLLMPFGFRSLPPPRRRFFSSFSMADCFSDFFCRHFLAWPSRYTYAIPK